jgi:hypothetical protein
MVFHADRGPGVAAAVITMVRPSLPFHFHGTIHSMGSSHITQIR